MLENIRPNKLFQMELFNFAKGFCLLFTRRYRPGDIDREI